jgi:hypothetical protein
VGEIFFLKGVWQKGKSNKKPDFSDSPQRMLFSFQVFEGIPIFPKI